VEEGVRRITLGEFGVTDTSAPPPEMGGIKKEDDDTFHHESSASYLKKLRGVEKFRSKVKVKVMRKEGFDLEFDLVGVDPSIANAIRRLLISDVPSMAIEKVYMYNNTSIIQDEVLSHRLGLIPLRADPRLFEMYNEKADTDGIYGNGRNTLEFELKVKCRKNPDAPAGSDNPDDLYLDSKIFTRHMKWVPRPGQLQMLSDGKETTPNPGPVEDDILISKMRPGHEMDIKMFAVKGVGRDHAKFSPVCTAYYRLLPEIRINRPVLNEAALRLRESFSPGVIDIVKNEDGDQEAVVKDARNDACSRNFYRYPDLADAVTLQKVPDHFIFTVESVGAVQPEDLVVQALDLLEDKCDSFLRELNTAKK